MNVLGYQFSFMLSFTYLNHTIRIKNSLEVSWNFQSSFHELFPTLLFEFYWIKISHFTELRSTLNLTLSLKTLHSFIYLNSGTIYSQWKYLFQEIIDKFLIRKWKIKVKTKIEAMSFMSLFTTLLIWEDLYIFVNFHWETNISLIQKDSINSWGFTIWCMKLHGYTSAHA